IRNNRYDCVLCDYQLIGGTGLDFLYNIRTQGMELPVIFLTGQGDETVAREAFVHGANDYFTKDVGFASYDRIYNAINSHVHHHLTHIEKKDMEQKLIMSDNIIHSLPLGLYVLKYRPPGDLYLLDANKTAKDYSHINLDESIDMEYTQIWSSEDAQRLKNEIIRSFEDNTVFRDDCFTFEVEGRKCHFIVNTFRLPDDKIGLSGYDITDIKETEIELQKSKTYLENLLYILNDINILSLDMVLRRIAEKIKLLIPFDTLSFYKIDKERKYLHPIYATGVDRDAIMGFEASINEGATGRVARGGKAEIINDPLSDRDIILIPGTLEKDEKMMSVPLKGHGDTIGVLNLFRTGTNFENVELEKAQMFAAQTSIALENALLFNNLKDTKELTDFFISMLAHDLKNPLFISRGYMDILLKEAPEANEVISKLLYQSDRMKLIIDNALLFARLEEGELSKHFEKMELGGLLSESVENFKHHPKYNNICFTPLDHECPIEALPLLVNVFSNLIDNALKYTSACRISYKCKDDHYEIEFEDDGHDSISSDELVTLMNKFTRGKNRERTGGHGLGLSIVRGMVGMHNGNITVKSGDMGGTIFVISIPRAIN
ncbi:MAG TPA: ATP-binding protein, partial [Candidatus Methanofastidiosa archaeon]|nr:ATP-binding protein [Candidatus Methanofastidiosa archaeon]